MPIGSTCHYPVPSTSFLSLDPGLTHPATALWTGGRLLCASRIRVNKEWSEECLGERCRLIGRAIHEWVLSKNFHPELLLVEWPQVYRASRSDGDPNDLPPMAGVDMALAGRLDVPVKSYTPSEWIGQIKKTTKGDARLSPRGKLIWAALDDQERAGVVVSHDSIDAVGIGLRYLDRILRRLYPGST